MVKIESQSNIKERLQLQEPHRYGVIFYNDDFTTMEFVVHVLVDVFFKSVEDSQHLMLKVHKEGQAMIGIYSYDLAMTRVEKVRAEAKKEKYPLRIEIKEM